MNKITNKIKKGLRRWLGIEEDHNKLDWLSVKVETLRRELHDQIEMVGLEAHLTKHQSEIIVISHLGRDGSGTVKIIPAYFKSLSEMMDFIKHMDRAVGEERMVVDPPFYDSLNIIADERRRRR